MDDLDRLDCLSDQCRDILRGLLHGHFYVSASEVVAVKQLEKYQFVDTWGTVGGFLAAKITRSGINVIKKSDARDKE